MARTQTAVRKNGPAESSPDGREALQPVGDRRRHGLQPAVVEDPDAMHARTLAAGAIEASPVADEPGCRLGRIIDPFGHQREIGRSLGA